MDNSTLVALAGFDIESGKSVLSELDKTGLEISSAFWLYFPDSKEWRLLLAMPALDTEGPKEVYSKIQDVINQHGSNLNIPLWSIGIISPNNSINQLLRFAIKTGEKSFSDIRFSGNVINGVLIDDAYIYRVN